MDTVIVFVVAVGYWAVTNCLTSTNRGLHWVQCLFHNRSTTFVCIKTRPRCVHCAV